MHTTRWPCVLRGRWGDVGVRCKCKPGVIVPVDFGHGDVGNGIGVGGVCGVRRFDVVHLSGLKLPYGQVDRWVL